MKDGNHDCAYSDDAGVDWSDTGKPYLKPIYLDILMHMHAPKTAQYRKHIAIILLY